MGGTGGQAPAVDCEAVCNRVQTLCEGQSTIDENWLSVCRSACEVRLQVTPDVALLEQRCVESTTMCTAAILCVASPTGSGGAGSGGTAGASGGG
jgi:hypothetical protein